MRAKVITISISLILIAIIGIWLGGQKDNPYSVEYSEVEIAWLEAHEGHTYTYGIVEDEYNIVDKVVVTLELITELNYTEKPVEDNNVQLVFGVEKGSPKSEIHLPGDELKIRISYADPTFYSIIQKTVNYINNTEMAKNLVYDLEFNESSEMFWSSLTETELNYLEGLEHLTVGFEAKAPEAISLEGSLYGTGISLLNRFEDITDTQLIFISGEKEKLFYESERYDIDLIWAHGLSAGLTTEPIISEKFVLAGIGSGSEKITKDNINDYNIGVLFDDHEIDFSTEGLDNNNLYIIENFTKAIDELENREIQLLVLPLSSFQYLEEKANYKHLDIQYYTDVLNEESLNVLNDDEILLSILNKLIMASNTAYLSEHAMDAIPEIEESNVAQIHTIAVISVLGLLIVLFVGIKYYISIKEKQHINYTFVHDQLTYLPNKYGIKQYVDEQIIEKHYFHMLLIKIDDYQGILDRFGHYYCDQMIIEFSQLLMGVMKQNIILARSGDNEFVVVSAEMNSMDGTEIAAQIKEISSEFENEKEELYKFTTNVSRISYPQHGRSYDDLYKYLEYTLEYGKSKNMDNWDMQFNSSIYEAYVDEQKMVEEIKVALEKEEFILFIQPQFSVATNKIIGGELLVRWMHPEKGILSPGIFLPIIEKNGLVRELDYYVLEKGCRQIKKWQEKYSKLKISINLTTVTFEDVNLIERLTGIIESVDMERDWLTIEITEDTGFREVEVIKALFTTIKSMGINIALDDFGTGYSSLSYINELDFDELKIDKSFVDNMHINEESYKIYKLIIDMAKALGLIMVIEGVETEEQVKIVNETKDAVVQGYYYSKPVNIKEFETFASNF